MDLLDLPLPLDQTDGLMETWIQDTFSVFFLDEGIAYM